MKFVERRPPTHLSRRISDAGFQSARPARCRYDAHLFWAHRCASAAIHPVLGQALPRLVSRRGCDVEAESRDYRGKLRKVLSIQSRWSWLVRARSSSARSGLGCPPEKIRINRTGNSVATISHGPRESPVDGRWRFCRPAADRKKGLIGHFVPLRFSIAKIHEPNCSSRARGRCSRN